MCKSELLNNWSHPSSAISFRLLLCQMWFTIAHAEVCEYDRDHHYIIRIHLPVGHREDHRSKKFTYAHAYLAAFRLPVNNGESSARNLISVFTFSASPVKIEDEDCGSVFW